MGEDWKSDGDGIYRHEPEPDATTSLRPKPDAALLTWTLDCGHEIPLLKHEQHDDPPRRSRICPICQKMQNVTVEP